MEDSCFGRADLPLACPLPLYAQSPVSKFYPIAWGSGRVGNDTGLDAHTEKAPPLEGALSKQSKGNDVRITKVIMV